jgi:hypothetical protein
MPTVTLNEMDLQAFLTAFNAIAEVTSYDFDDETEYRLAIANLVGALRNQLPSPPRGMIRVIPRVSLAEVLEEKYRQWDEACAAGSNCQSAASLIGEYLDRVALDSSSYTAETDAGDAIVQLRTLLTTESAAGWNNCELGLCAATAEEIARLRLNDLLDSLFAAGNQPAPGRSLWSRWTKK